LKRIIFALLLLPIVFCGCKESGLMQSLYDYTSSQAATSSEDYDLNIVDFTKFQWQKMYIFKAFAQKSYIESVIGAEFKGPEESFGAVVFIQDNNIVYREDLDYNPDDPPYLNILFSSIFSCFLRFPS